jgi:hypothetical protein
MDKVTYLVFTGLAAAALSDDVCHWAFQMGVSGMDTAKSPSPAPGTSAYQGWATKLYTNNVVLPRLKSVLAGECPDPRFTEGGDGLACDPVPLMEYLMRGCDAV